MNTFFAFKNTVTAAADPKMNNPTAKKLWKSFCLEDGCLTLTVGNENSFVIGEVSLPELREGKEYALKITEKGVAVIGDSYGGLMRGFFSLLMKIEYSNDGYRIPTGFEESNYVMKNRMIHFCLFPENAHIFAKMVRLAALCQYTHVVLEFWGMLKYDCLKELAWDEAWTKEEAKALITEVKELGMEAIPMFNHLGHATASRVCYGKHVVLDQNPRLQRLFTPDGWAWDITSPEVKELLCKVRAELYELFGDCEYFHLGCDEAYYITRCSEVRRQMPQYLKELTEETVKEGKRPMVWMDMFLESGKYPGCYTVCPPEDVNELMDCLDKQTVLVDWQYNIKTAPIPSLASLKDRPFDAMGAPWFNAANYKAHIDTITEYDLFGIMMTTWHTFKADGHGVLGCAKQLGAVTFNWSSFSGLREETATLLRRVSFGPNNYENSGWSKLQIDV